MQADFYNQIILCIQAIQRIFNYLRVGGVGGGGTKHVKESVQVFLVNVHLTEIDQWL